MVVACLWLLEAESSWSWPVLAIRGRIVSGGIHVDPLETITVECLWLTETAPWPISPDRLISLDATALEAVFVMCRRVQTPWIFRRLAQDRRRVSRAQGILTTVLCFSCLALGVSCSDAFDFWLQLGPARQIAFLLLTQTHVERRIWRFLGLVSGLLRMCELLRFWLVLRELSGLLLEESP